MYIPHRFYTTARICSILSRPYQSIENSSYITAWSITEEIRDVHYSHFYCLKQRFAMCFICDTQNKSHMYTVHHSQIVERRTALATTSAQISGIVVFFFSLYTPHFLSALYFNFYFRMKGYKREYFLTILSRHYSVTISADVLNFRGKFNI